jgi:uncharacterized membrane protein YgdD (TMEM256/DUF423 family)
MVGGGIRPGPIAVLGALNGLLAVGFGAFGAHALSGQHAAWATTGAHYQAIHALALFVCAAAPAWRQGRARVAAIAVLAGVAFFCTSLYGLAFGAPRILGAVTPIGGVSFMIGWAALAWTYWPGPPPAASEPRAP